MSIPKWVSNLAIVGLIFTVGGYAARIELGLSSMNSEIEELKNKRIAEIEKKMVAIETAISIHHGRDWSDKVQKNTLMKVEDLEEQMGGISKKFEQSVSTLGSNFNSTVHSVDDLQKRISAVDLWTRQGDNLIKRSRLEQFRALAVYASAKSDNPSEILINKQHRRGGNFKNGDSVLLINPLPPGQQVEVTVKGFLDDPASSSVLVQLNEELLDDLGLNTQGGQYELFIQSKPKALRWKTLDELYKELSNSQR